LGRRSKKDPLATPYGSVLLYKVSLWHGASEATRRVSTLCFINAVTFERYHYLREKRPMLEIMKTIVKENDLCVLATVSEGKPHCSLMAYSASDDCREIYMVTRKNTSKYINLLENPSVSLLIDTREENAHPLRSSTKALTVNGLFQKTYDEEKRRLIRVRLLETHPFLKQILDHPDAEFLCILVESFLLLNGPTEEYFERL
jgi:nitroimidazol reductase NimA-like FMN-containing flavoprotein (pyridoxamine 5'-phosphate oxidase superfamily)